MAINKFETPGDQVAPIYEMSERVSDLSGDEVERSVQEDLDRFRRQGQGVIQVIDSASRRNFRGPLPPPKVRPAWLDEPLEDFKPLN
jgi:hypothetical protein